MFGAVLWTLRQRRYAALAIAMAVVALACIGAGTFEVHRYSEKRHDNSLLRANAHAAATPLRVALVPLTGQAPPPDAFALRYRTVTALGRYDAADERYIAEQSQDGRRFQVMTPLRTSAGMLLVVRGFVAATSQGTRPAVVPAPPTGIVRITGRLQTAQTTNDHAGEQGHGEITSINPNQQAARLGVPAYQTYLTLNAHQPGTVGLSAVPGPDLANPTGGAAEWQLMSYVVQWYVFALLALLAPFLLRRAVGREARRRYLGIDPDAAELGTGAERQAVPHQLAAGSPSGVELTVRSSAALAERGNVAARRWERAARLADRYGRSLGTHEQSDDALPQPVPKPVTVTRPVVRGNGALHRSVDAYHGSYNDYLWQLSLADGNAPDVFVAARADGERPVPRIIEASDQPPRDDDDSCEHEHR